MTPSISVIFPVYNCEAYVEAAMASILSQEVDLEIVAVDDGSTDQTGFLLDTIAKKEPKLRVFHQKNSGVAAARNYAIAQAKGQWIAFCDGDDTVPPNAYRRFLEKSDVDDIDVIVGDYRNASDTSGVTKQRSRRVRGLTPFQTLFLVPCLWTKLIRRNYLEQHHITFEDMKLGEDVVFLAELAATFPRVAYVPACVYYHWSHDLGQQSSLTHQYRPELFELHLECRRKLLEISERAGIQEAKKYVYHELTDFLTSFLFCMESGEGQRRAFQSFRQFMLQYDWSAQPGACLGELGVTEQELETISAEQFFERGRQILPRDRVLVQFETGQIGFQYILKYIKAWMAYKFKKKC